MQPLKLSQFIAILAWVSVFIQTWFMLLRISPLDWLSWVGWLFFLVVGVMASSVASAKRPTK